MRGIWKESTACFCRTTNRMGLSKPWENTSTDTRTPSVWWDTGEKPQAHTPSFICLDFFILMTFNSPYSWRWCDWKHRWFGCRWWLCHYRWLQTRRFSGPHFWWPPLPRRPSKTGSQITPATAATQVRSNTEQLHGCFYVEISSNFSPPCLKMLLFWHKKLAIPFQVYQVIKTVAPHPELMQTS